jgi:PAS domain S-box-containing protein
MTVDGADPDAKTATRERGLLAAIVASSSDAIVSKNLDGVITSWNRGAERLFGYTEEEARGQPVTMLIPEDRIDEEPGILSRIRRGERVEHYETIRRHKDGSLIDISLTVSPVVDDQGTIVGASKVARDITERRRAAAKLAESEERYRRLAELLPVGVYTCEAPSGTITYFNEHAARLWGRAPEPGDTDERFFGSAKLFLPDGTLLRHADCPMAVALREGRKFRNREVIIERLDGSRATALVNIDPIRDAAGRILGAINVFHDVTEAKRVEQALREQKENLQALLDTLPVAVVIAHDRDCRHISGNRAAVDLLRMRSDADLSLRGPESDGPMHFQVSRSGRRLPPEQMPVQRHGTSRSSRSVAGQLGSTA